MWEGYKTKEPPQDLLRGNVQIKVDALFFALPNLLFLRYFSSILHTLSHSDQFRRYQIFL